MHKIKLILAFFIASIGAFGQIGVIDANTSGKPPQGLAKISFKQSKLFWRKYTGDSLEIINSGTSYSNPSWLTLSISKITGLQTDLDARAPLASPTFTGTVSGVTKSMVGLSNVDNTSDANKPISTAQQTAINAKENSLGNPSTDGYLLSSTVLGTRSWVPPSYSIFPVLPRQTSIPAPTAGLAVGNILGNVYVKDSLGISRMLVDSATVNSQVLKNDGYLENKGAFAEFMKKIYGYNASSSGVRIGIAWYGDSVSPAVSGEFMKGLGNNYPIMFLNYPDGIQTVMTYTNTGVIKYNGTSSGQVNQAILDGLVNVTSITRSGSTATLTSSSAHRLTTGAYVTVSGASQTEYNGTFQVLSAPTSTTLTYTVTGTPATPATGTIQVYGGVSDFTYLPNGMHIELTNGATTTFSSGENYGYAKYEVYLAKDATSGTAIVDLLAYDGTTVLQTATINLFSASTTAIKQTFTVSDPNLKYKVRITATNKVVVLGCYSLYDNGLVSVNFGMGGTTINQNNYSNDAILDYLFTNLNIGLVFVMAKEEGLPNSLTNLKTRLNRQTIASKIIIGSLPDSTPESSQVINNTYFRNFALNNNYGFFDAKKLFVNYARLTAIGENNDGTHAGANANKFVADVLLSEIGVLNTAQSTIKLGINQTFARNAVTDNILSKVSIINPYQPTIPVPVVVHTANSGDANRVNITNVRELMFNGANASYTKVGGYGTAGVGVFKQDGTFAEMNALRYLTSGTGVTSLNGLQLTGAVGTTTVYQANAGTDLGLTTNGGGIRLFTVGGAYNFYMNSSGNIGIGTNSPNAAATLDVVSTTKGSRPIPLMTTTQRNAIASPVAGLLVYDTDLLRVMSYDGTVWGTVGSLTGSFTTTATAQTAFTVTLPTTMPNSTYKVEVTPTSAIVGGGACYVSSKTTTNFVLTCNSLTGTASFDWAVLR